MSNINDRKEIEEQVMNKLIYYISQHISQEHLDNGKMDFDEQLRENKYIIEESEFNSWFIWEYKINGESIIEIFLKNNNDLTTEERETLEGLNNSYMSIYECEDKGDYKICKDIFLKTDYKISNIPYETKNKMIMGRVYRIKDNYYMFDDCFVIDTKYKGGVDKSFYNNFEEYKKKADISMEEFLKNGYLFLISIINIIFNVKQEDSTDESLCVFQSDYAVVDYDTVIDKILDQPVIEFEESISDNEIYILYRDSEKIDVVAELVINQKKLEIECVSERDRDSSKRFVEKLLEKAIVHLSDQFVTMEDL